MLMVENAQVGFLLIHGFTGTHFDMEPLEIFLKNRNYTVFNIVLPGHETSEEDLETKKWFEWTNYAQEKLDQLKNMCAKIFVIGLSMGGAITLFLGYRNPDIDGLITLATPCKTPDWKLYVLRALPFIVYLYSRHPNIDCNWEDLDTKKVHKCYAKIPTRSALQLHKLLINVKKNLFRITNPILILQSKNDETVSMKHAKQIFNKVKSKDKKMVQIEKGGHVISVDSGKEQAFAAIEEWIKERIV